MTQEQLSKSALLVIGDYKWQTTLSSFLMEGGYDPTKADNLHDAYLRSLVKGFDLYVVGGNGAIIPGTDMNIGSPLDFYEKINGRGNPHAIIVSQGSDSELEERCNMMGIKFMDLGTGEMPDFERVMEFIEYLKTL